MWPGSDGPCVATPTDPDRPRDTDGAADGHADHLARSRRVWDRWSDHYGLSESDFEPMREAAIEHLDLAAGDRVLDVGCGPGVNLETLRAAVGPEGEVVAVDYSPEMVAAARERVDEHGWDNVTVRRADASTADIGGPYDAAVATLAMSVMPDVRAAVANVRDALVPGARFVVFDLRAVPSGPARVLNPLLRRFFYWFANWNPEGDVLGSLEGTFGQVEVVEAYALGAAYTAVATRAE